MTGQVSMWSPGVLMIGAEKADFRGSHGDPQCHSVTRIGSELGLVVYMVVRPRLPFLAVVFLVGTRS